MGAFKPDAEGQMVTTTSVREWLAEHAEAVRANLVRHGAEDLIDMLGVGEVPC